MFRCVCVCVFDVCVFLMYVCLIDVCAYMCVCVCGRVYVGVCGLYVCNVCVCVCVCMNENVCVYPSFVERGLKTEKFIPKLYLRLLWFFRRTAALFRQIRTFPQLFRFCSDLGNPGIRQIVRNSMLTGRREGRILINLCGNNNVRNCDLLQRDFFDRCKTVLGVAKGFFWYVVKIGKR